MTREDSINRMPKQGKHESDSHYIARLHKEVEDEMAKIEFARKQKVVVYALLLIQIIPDCTDRID